MVQDNELEVYARQSSFWNNPQASDRGVPISADRVWSHLDWLAFSTEYIIGESGTDHLVVPFMADWLVAETSCKPLPRFRYGADLRYAGRVFWNDTAEKGCHVVLTGDDLARLRQALPITDDDLIKRISKHASNVARMDFATNINAGHPRELLEAFQEDKVTTRVRHVRHLEDHGRISGFTLYFGSPKSAKMLRVYDKMMEGKIKGWIPKYERGVWTRIELQLRDTQATMLAKAMSDHSVKEAGKLAIRNFVNCESLQWFSYATAGDNFDMVLTPKKRDAFLVWIETQVKPAIEKRSRAGLLSEELLVWSNWLQELYNENVTTSPHD